MRKVLCIPLFLTLSAFAIGDIAVAQGLVSGELRQWHRVAITFAGPSASELGSPNPFRDYRLSVTFTKGAKTYVVPGFYAAHGNAGETSASTGTAWRAHFAPDETGTWFYAASFRTGTDIAVDSDPIAGTPTAFDGVTGPFAVVPSDKSGRDHRGKGRLEYVGMQARVVRLHGVNPCYTANA